MNHRNSDIEYHFDLLKFNRYSNIITSHTIVRECVEFLVNVSTSGIKIEVYNTEEMRKYFNDVLLPFIRHALRTTILAGWFQYKYLKNPLRPIVVPFQFTYPRMILSCKTFETTFAYLLDGEDKYRYYGSNNMYSMFMYDNGSYMNGSCMYTPIDAFFADFELLMIRKRAGLRADVIRACPTVYLNRVPDQVVKPGTVPGELFNGLRDVGQAPGMYRIAGNHEQPGNQEDEWKRLSEMAHNDIDANIMFHEHQAQMHRSTVLEDTYAPQYENNVYIPPPDKQLAGVPHLPQPVTDLLNSEIYVNTTIYKSFGLSRLEGIRGKNKFDRSQQNEQTVEDIDALEMIATLERYNWFVTRMIKKLHSDIFGEELRCPIRVTVYTELVEHIRPKEEEEELQKDK